jgi:hypothetical protein
MRQSFFADRIDRPAVVADELERVRRRVPEIGQLESGIDALGFPGEEAEAFDRGGVVVVVPEFLVKKDVVVIGGDGGLADGVGVWGLQESVLGGGNVRVGARFLADALVEIAADGQGSPAAREFVELAATSDVGDAVAGVAVEGVLGPA